MVIRAKCRKAQGRCIPRICRSYFFHGHRCW